MTEIPEGTFLNVRDLAGRTVRTWPLNQREGQLVWDTRGSGSGTYIVEITSANEALVPAQKLVLQP